MLEDGRISGGQALKLLIITVMATELLFLPGVAAEGAGRDAWLVPVVTTAVAAVLVLVQTRLALQFPDQTLAQYGPLVLGSYLGKVIGLAYSWFFFHLALLVLRQFGDFMVTVFMTNTPPVVLMMVIAFLVVFLLKNGLECLARVNEVIIVIIVGAILVVWFLIVKDLEPKQLQPILAEGIGRVFWTARVPLVWYGELVVLLFFFPYLENSREGPIIGLAALLFLGFFFTVTTAAPLMVFGPEETARMPYPLFSLARMLQVAFLERMESVVMAIWVGGIFVKTGVFMWCSVLSLAQTLNLQDYRPLVSPLGVLLVALSLLSVENYWEFREWGTNVFPFYGLVFEFFIPLVLLAGTHLRSWLDPSFPQKP